MPKLCKLKSKYPIRNHPPEQSSTEHIHYTCMPCICILMQLRHNYVTDSLYLHEVSCAHEQKPYGCMCIVLVGTVNGGGYDGQQQYTSYLRQLYRSCHLIRRIPKPVFAKWTDLLRLRVAQMPRFWYLVIFLWTTVNINFGVVINWGGVKVGVGMRKGGVSFHVLW